MSEKTLRRLALLVASLSSLLLVAGIVLWILAMLKAGKPVGLFSHQLTIPLSGVGFIGLGALVLSRQPRQPIAWLLAGLGLISGIELLNLGFLAYMSRQAPGEIIRVPDVAHWLAQWLYAPRSMVPLTLLLLLFPDGRLPSKRWRPVAWLTVLAITTSTFAAAFTQSSWEGMGGIVRNPYVIDSQILNTAGLVSGALLLVIVIAAPLTLLARFRQATGTLRQQLKWVAFGTGLILVLLVVAAALFVAITNRLLALEFIYALVNITTIIVSIAVSIAVLHYRLYDIDVIINRTLVYGILTTCVVAIYVVVVGGLGELLHTTGNLVISLVATGLIAVIFQPLRERLQAGINQLFYGLRDNPMAALLRLGQHLETAIAPEIVLPTLVQTISQTLKLPYVAVTLRSTEGFVMAAESGTAVDGAVTMLLNFQGELLGQLIVGPRNPGETFSPEERQLLENIAHQAGPTVYAARLTMELRQSRIHLVTAREEERRRLRRNLHDGLGPLLASQGLKMAAVTQLVQSDPQRAGKILEDLTIQNEETVAEIRRLVYDLRPAALDDLGLLGAVRDYASTIRGNGRDSARIMIDVSTTGNELPPLPAAIEVAAYRISTEALTNIARHSQARRASVHLVPVGANGAVALHLEIRDDGTGLPANFRAGVGIISMRERAEEVGGTIRIEQAPGHGTQVVADLPLAVTI